MNHQKEGQLELVHGRNPSMWVHKSCGKEVVTWGQISITLWNLSWVSEESDFFYGSWCSWGLATIVLTLMTSVNHWWRQSLPRSNCIPHSWGHTRLRKSVDPATWQKVLLFCNWQLTLLGNCPHCSEHFWSGQPPDTISGVRVITLLLILVLRLIKLSPSYTIRLLWDLGG